MGHMNVRLYVEKQVEGLAAFTHALDMPLAFQESAPSTLVPVDQHVRFIREVLPGRPISMDGCIVSVGESDAVIYQELRHSDGALSAAFLTRVAHVDTKARERFAWSTRARAALEAHIDTPPAEAAPRSFDPNAPALATTDINIATARNLGIPMIGKGAVPQHHLDVHGCMSPAWIIGRISDSVPNLLYDWRKRVADAAGGVRMGAAVLENRLRYHRWPKAGDLYEIHTSLGSTAEKTHSLVHWVMDPVTGLPWATSQVVAITLDLDARKAIATPPAMLEDLERIAPRGLSL
nr:acyl-ACP thioesterase [Hyphomonas oceanitis]